MASTISPVPSGEPSSTTSRSSRASCTRADAINRSMLSRSLYVGTMTSARSLIPGSCRAGVREACALEPDRDRPPEERGERGEGRDPHADRKRRVVEDQIDGPAPRGEWHTDERVV